MKQKWAKKQKEHSLIRMIFVIILTILTTKCYTFLNPLYLETKEDFYCNFQSGHLVSNQSKLKSSSLYSNNYTKNGRLIYADENDCTLHYGCTAFPTSSKLQQYFF